MSPMNVYIDDTKAQVEFGTLAPGTVFEYNGNYYMRIVKSYVEDGGSIAVLLKVPEEQSEESTDAEPFSESNFLLDTMVTPHNSNLSIEV